MASRLAAQGPVTEGPAGGVATAGRGGVLFDRYSFRAGHGVATAFPVGERWAAGASASYRWHATYTPVAGSGELVPGGEGRVRLGVEGPLGSAGYLRGAVLYTASGADTLQGSSRSITGDRVLVYTSLSVPPGPGSLALYAYDKLPFRPRASKST